MDNSSGDLPVVVENASLATTPEGVDVSACSNSDGIKKNYVVSVPDAREGIEYSIKAPLLISTILCFVDIVSHYSIGKLSIETLTSIFHMINGYMDITVLSAAVFLVFQQFFLFIPAGLSKKRGILLAGGIFAYTVAIVVHTVLNVSPFEEFVMFCVTVAMAVFTNKSLKIGSNDSKTESQENSREDK